MIGTSLPELVFIRVSIFLLQYSIPIAIAIVLILQAGHGPPILAKIFITILALDLIYALLIYLPFKARLRAVARHPRPLTKEERQALFERCVANVPDPERYFRLWFLDAEPEEIKRDNIEDFLLWAFFDRASIKKVETATQHVSRRDLAESVEGGERQRLLDGHAGAGSEDDAEDVAALEQELETYLARTEDILGRPLPPGRGSATPLRLTIDLIESRYRSVLWYALVSLVDFTTHMSLFWHGYQLRAPSWRRALSVFPLRPELLMPSLPGMMQNWKGRSPSDQLSYWFRPHTAKTGLPVVFIHGIGIGLHPYTNFLGEIPRETGVIALEILPISMRLCSAPLPRPEFLRQLELILAHHGWDRFVLVSHSYGSVLTTHILRSPSLSPKVDGIVLVDPVSICLHLPDVAYNFTRRKPRRANEWQLWYFASMDPGTALALGRHFFWRENQIWKEELVTEVGVSEHRSPAGAASGSAARKDASAGRKRKVAVSLSGRDLIVDTTTVAQYLLYEGTLSEAGALDFDDLVAALEDTQSETGDHFARNGIEVLWFPKLDHAQVFDGKKERGRVLDVIDKYCSYY